MAEITAFEVLDVKEWSIHFLTRLQRIEGHLSRLEYLLCSLVQHHQLKETWNYDPASETEVEVPKVETCAQDDPVNFSGKVRAPRARRKKAA